jgi:hypothetical protein
MTSIRLSTSHSLRPAGTVTDNPRFDPVLPLIESARYLGFRGKDPVKSLRRLNLERTPIPGTGRRRPKFGHKLSVLNAHRDSLSDPKSRAHLRAAS